MEQIVDIVVEFGLELFDFVLGLLLPIVAAWLVSKLAKKPVLKRVVREAIDYAEHAGYGDVAEDKLALAVAWAQARLDEKGWGAVDVDQLVSIIEGQLAEHLNWDKLLE